MKPLLRCAALLLSLVVLMPVTAGALDDWPSSNRVYLLGSDNEFLYWSTDPGDPELGAVRVERQCSAAIQKGLPGSNRCDFLFLPATQIRGPIPWGPGKKLHFRLRLDITTPGTPSVVVASQSQSANNQAPATQTSPGVWEADVASGINPSSWSMFVVHVTASVPHVTATLHLGGASYIDLPSPVSAAGVPRLQTEAPPPQQSQSVETGLRSFSFNDDQWALSSFSGTLDQSKDFGMTLSRPATSVVAWVEIFGTPFSYDVVRGRSPDARKLVEASEVELFRDGTSVATGTKSGVYGVGTNAAAAVDLPAGELVLRVEPTDFRDVRISQGSSYTAYVLTVYGERTLARMHWLSMLGGSTPSAVNTVGAGVCPGVPGEQVPVSTKVTSLAVDMRVDTVGGPTSRWVLAYLLQPNSWFLCDEGSGGDSVRFTYPNHGVQLVGPTVKRDTTYAEWRETLFEFEARFTYSPIT